MAYENGLETHPIERGKIKCSVTHPSGRLNYSDMRFFVEEVPFEVSAILDDFDPNTRSYPAVKKIGYVKSEDIAELQKRGYNVNIE